MLGSPSSCPLSPPVSWRSSFPDQALLSPGPSLHILDCPTCWPGLPRISWAPGILGSTLFWVPATS